MKRIGRGLAASSSTASAALMWLQTRIAAPWAGMCACPRTVQRQTPRVSTKAAKRSRYSGTTTKTAPATTAFSSPTTRNTSGMPRPAFSSSPTPSELAMMKRALRMLLAAMMRARCEGWLRNWISAYIGTL
jgi:hypothetical protein